MNTIIKTIRAREILSTGAFPTLETTVTLENGITGTASVPFGSSAGKYEAVTLRDGDPNRYDGLGMLNAVRNVNEIIAPAVLGYDVLEQLSIDKKLISLDSTPQREQLGGNSILSVSLACVRAASVSCSKPLYEYLLLTYGLSKEFTFIPKPLMVVMEGGRHADNSTDLQEYMIGVLANINSSNAVRAGIEVYHALGRVLKANGYSINVGLEGAYALTSAKSNREPLVYLKQAISDAGYSSAEIGMALDPAASEIYKQSAYCLDRENRKLSSEEFINYCNDLVEEFGIFCIEDGLGEDDWDSWPLLNKRLGDKVMIMGDDLTATNVPRLQKAIDMNAINSILIKPNQVGTLSETIAAIKLAQKCGLKVVVSHRGGGETTDTLIIDLAVATRADFVKVGPSRGERVVKYNRLMEIGEELGL